MPPKKELCVHFQSGRCRFGDRCRNLHPTQQQSKTNPFGFGGHSGTPFQNTNQQQQKPNPFGFGVQNNTQRGVNDTGFKPGQVKPFENKWTRSTINTGSAPVSRQSDNKPAAADHKCTDPELCKRVIVEDLKDEKPEWKLTCYGHNRSGPCDIVGDISCEELRALAYDDAKIGKSMQFIIDRERSLLDSKLAEFQQLVQKPFMGSSDAGGARLTAPTGVSPSVSSFSQLGTSLNTGAVAAPSYTFGQSSAFQNQSQPSSMFQTKNLPSNSSGAFGQSSAFQNQSQPSSMFQTKNLPSNSSGAFGQSSAFQNQSQPSSMFQMKNLPFNSSEGPNSSTLGAQKNPFSTFTNSSQVGNVANNQLNFVSNLPSSASNAFGQSSMSTQLISNMPKESSDVDGTIWLKAEWKWNMGEIPEEAPPDIYIH